MITTYYDIMTAASLLMAVLYVFAWHKHYDVHITLIFALVPISNLGYALVSKHVYKESMGGYFDPALEPYYLAARPRLEAYYRSLQGAYES